MKAGHKAWHELFESYSFYLPRSFGPTLAIDGRQLLMSSKNTIELWKLNESPPKKAVVPQPHQGKYALSADGRLLVAGLEDSALHLIDVATGKEMRIVANFPRIRDFSPSPDGKLLAACGTEGLCLWDTATGTLQAQMNGHRGTVTTVTFSPDGGALVSAAHDGTALIWDVAKLIAKPELKALTAGELQSLWDDLASDNAQTAGKAMRRLSGHPRQTATLLREELRPVSASKEMMAKLVADLDDARPKIRENATKELKELAEIAEPALRACLAGTPTLEQRLRVEQILARLRLPIADASKLRALRCVEVLNVIGTPEAIVVLQTIAAGADSAYETREARAALKRKDVK